jgi:hypothetical protein
MLKPFYFIVILLLITCCFGPSPLGTDDPTPTRSINTTDSIIVRELLDTNGLYGILVKDVADFQTSFKTDGRVYALHFDSLGLTSLRLLKKAEFLDSLVAIYCFNNRINKVIVDDTLHFQHKDQCLLDLRYNALETFPLDLFKITSPGGFAFYLYFNNISYVPNEVVNKTNYNYLLSGNRLCNVSDTINDWMTGFVGANWRAAQTCP